MSEKTEGWEIEKLDLAAYLDRIGVRVRPPSRQALDELHEAHVRTFTFDNIDVLLDQHPGVALDAIQHKFVQRGRGGYCFEHVILFAAALERLGYTVQRRLGRVSDQARTHAVIAVHLDGETLLADPGFTLSVLHPIVLKHNAHTDHGGWTFRVRESWQGPVRAWELYRRRAGTWEPVHTHDELPVHLADVLAGNHYTSTYPTIHFRTRLMLTRHGHQEHTTLTHSALTIRRPGQATDHRPLDLPEVRAWIRRLQVPLTNDEERRLLDKVAKIRDREKAASAATH